ncbi:hypothetical protein KJ765_02470 [Candidatus Micrarchaeota archaeon]|nr:hypothetical protein [Candidatus Micrarchaeota archaeon]
MAFDAQFVYALVFIAVILWMMLRFFLGIDGFGNALIATLIGFVLLPNLLQQGLATFLVLIAIGGLAIQQIYRTGFTDSVVITLIAMVLGSYLLPFLGAF